VRGLSRPARTSESIGTSFSPRVASSACRTGAVWFTPVAIRLGWERRRSLWSGLRARRALCRGSLQAR
jgi:hypothetical protein